MARKKAAILTLLVVAAGTGCGAAQSNTPTPGIIQAEVHDRPPLGVLEHRGRFYDLRDLMNPDYRAASTDPFVRDFSPDTVLAGMRPRPQPVANPHTAITGSAVRANSKVKPRRK
jgi:hypothetical protein